MHVLALFAIALVFFGLDQAWKRHRIRAVLSDLGRTIVSVRWQPMAGFDWFRAQRDTSSFRVTGTTRDGEGFDCRCVASVTGVVVIQDDRRQPAVTSGRSISAARDDRSPPRLGAELAFHAACAGSALVSALWMGASYWIAPAKSLQLPDGLYGLGLASVPVAAFALATWRRGRALVIVAWGTAAVVAVVSVRAKLDLGADPGSHGLLGIEIAIALFVGLAASSIGLGAAKLARFAANALR